MKPQLLATAVSLAILTACAQPDAAQYVIETPDVAAAQRSRTTVEILDVSLPLYAQGQNIPVADTSGAIYAGGSAVWAETPSRAISLGLAEALAKLTGAVVAVEPWPLDEAADVKLDLRVKTLLASADGSLRFSGQYFVVFASGRPARSDWFDITIPVAGTSGPDVSKATGAAVTELAKTLSRQIR